MRIIIINLSNNYQNCHPSLSLISKKHTLLSKQIQTLNTAFPNTIIYLISHIKNNKVYQSLQNHNIPIINVPWTTVNNLYYLSLVDLDQPILLLPSNLFIKPSIFRNFSPNQSTVWITSQPMEIGTIVHQNILKNMMFGLTNYWSQICYFHYDELYLLRCLFQSGENIAKWYIFEAINWIINAGGLFYTINIKQNIKIY